MSCFSAANILLPRETDLTRWAVIACDQFTSQPEYWHAVREQAGQAPSAYHIIFPEAELGRDEDARIQSINAAMRRYLSENVFDVFPSSFVYVERELQDGTVRRGVVGVIDLEEYDYRSDAASAVRATEQTVVERIPPRVRIRSGACLKAVCWTVWRRKRPPSRPYTTLSSCRAAGISRGGWCRAMTPRR